MDEYERQWLKDKKVLEEEQAYYNYSSNAIKQLTKKTPPQPIIF